MQKTRKSFWCSSTNSWENSNPFNKNYIAPAVKRIRENSFENAARDIREIVSGRKNCNEFAKDVGTEAVQTQLGREKEKPKRRTRETIFEKEELKRVEFARTFFEKKI